MNKKIFRENLKVIKEIIVYRRGSIKWQVIILKMSVYKIFKGKQFIRSMKNIQTKNKIKEVAKDNKNHQGLGFNNKDK